jgi:hypothetical protein
MSKYFIPTLSVLLLTTACGSSNTDPVDDGVSQVEDVVEQGQIVGPFSTGTSAEPSSVYFDLDSAQVMTLTDAEAATNSEWDIAFNRTQISLNTHSDNTVGTYTTAVNADFIDDAGNAIAELFLAADADTELADYLAVGIDDLPSSEAFSFDALEYAVGDKFYDYDFITHQVSAAQEAYFIVSSDSAYSKFRAKSLTTSGMTMASITLAVQHQSALDGAVEFAPEQDLVIDTRDCSADVYIDFDLIQAVSQDDAWDIRMPCITESDITGADFQILLAEDATALVDTTNSYTGIDSQAESFYGFQTNLSQVNAMDTNPWYQYGLNGGQLLWSQFGVYLIQTNSATYKLQVTSYYDTSGTSGNYSFRFDAIN